MVSDGSGGAGEVEFTSATYSVNENAPGGVAAITLKRVGGTNGQIQVMFTTSDGTASSPSDYTDSDQAVVFNEGETTKTVDIPIADDSVAEANETVNLAVSHPPVILAAPGEGPSAAPIYAAVLTIVNDDCPASFTVNNNGDAVDANVGDGVCATAGSVCTLRAAIRPETRVLGITWVHSCTGVRMPVRAVADMLAQVNGTRGDHDRIRLVVDGVHALGAVDETVASPGCAQSSLVARVWPAVAKSSVRPARAVSRVSLFYNAGLQNSWFIVTGMIGMLLVMLGSLVSSASMVKEKEVGTVEQLLMTPAGSAEIILAKMAPIFLLLSLDIGVSSAVGSFVFGVPIRGSFALLYCSGMLCVLSGIGIGTIVATFTRSQQQAQLLSFFVNPPLSMLSGATTPIEAMPHWMQPLTNLNPVKHFAVLARGVMLKGVGLEVLYPNFLALLAFTVILVGVSAWRFRKQLN